MIVKTRGRYLIPLGVAGAIAYGLITHENALVPDYHVENEIPAEPSVLTYDASYTTTANVVAGFYSVDGYDVMLKPIRKV